MMSSLNILIIDDEANIRKTLSICLESRGHSVKSVSNCRDALSEAGREVFDLAFVDLRLGTESGLDLIPVLREACPWMKIVMITAYASVETAVEAMKLGASDYISKPFTPDQVQVVTGRVSEIRNMEQRIASMKDDLDRFNPGVDFESSSPLMQKAVATARQAAASDASILLRGESGTGKSELAKAIHAWSARSAKPFSVVSCPALSPELLESELFGHAKGAFTGAVRDNPGRIASCEGGTLFLDEAGDLPVQLQSKLLRFMQGREYERVGDNVTRRANVRVIAATNRDLEAAVKAGAFREDLYYRLNVIQIELPPLDGRPEDIEKLACRMLSFFAAQNHKTISGFSVEAMAALRNYRWPGNIRELRNVVERAAILCPGEKVGTESLPSSISAKEHEICLGDSVSLESIEEAHIRRVIASTKSLQEAAEVLGIDQATLWRKRKQFGF